MASDTLIQDLREAFFSTYGEHAAHNSEVGRLLGFEVGGTGGQLAK